MLGLPESTEIKKTIYKKVIYSKFEKELSDDRRKSFDTDISRITIMNEISPISVNINEGEKVKAIFVVLVNVKSEKVDERNLALIAKLFGQYMLLVMEYEDKYRLVAYQTKVLRTEWLGKEAFEIKLHGLDLDSVWENIVVQIGGIRIEEGNTLNRQIEIDGEKDKLRKQIDVLEKQARNEKQPKRKFEMFQRIKAYKAKMEEL
ncbi:DUF4391 domain-containing protein [Anaerobium acetethylicum]|uniref:DUF4391 domain-containing protein n=1 Tax=Anaerobium acetethylicum TaxID=1619234 RepID=A0A1D3TXN5_9FIRM|nr:DUF4391 domain-containing protein [Anaerobium acetethylicum]SCP99140.1 protein of unknown function [Anaerobium acetethylicum]